MLTGKLPFVGTNSMQVLHSLHFSPPRDLSELRAEVPSELVALIGRMLVKEPDKRIQTMGEVLGELRRCARVSMDGSRTWDKSWMSAAPIPRKVHTKYLWPAIAVLIALLAGGYGIQRWTKRSASIPATAPLNDIPAGASAYALYQTARQDLDDYGGNGRVERAIQLLEDRKSVV